MRPLRRTMRLSRWRPLSALSEFLIFIVVPVGGGPRLGPISKARRFGAPNPGRLIDEEARRCQPEAASAPQVRLQHRASSGWMRPWQRAAGLEVANCRAAVTRARSDGEG